MATIGQMVVRNAVAQDHPTVKEFQARRLDEIANLLTVGIFHEVRIGRDMFERRIYIHTMVRGYGGEFWLDFFLSASLASPHGYGLGWKMEQVDSVRYGDHLKEITDAMQTLLDMEF